MTGVLPVSGTHVVENTLLLVTTIVLLTIRAMSILSDSSGEFEVILQGETSTTTYTDYNDIPRDQLQAVVNFAPNVPPAPHTINEHQSIGDMNAAFESLMEDVVTPPATRIGDADVPHCSGMVRAVGSPNVRVRFAVSSRFLRLGSNAYVVLLMRF